MKNFTQDLSEWLEGLPPPLADWAEKTLDYQIKFGTEGKGKKPEVVVQKTVRDALIQFHSEEKILPSEVFKILAKHKAKYQASRTYREKIRDGEWRERVAQSFKESAAYAKEVDEGLRERMPDVQWPDWKALEYAFEMLPTLNPQKNVRKYEEIEIREALEELTQFFEQRTGKKLVELAANLLKAAFPTEWGTGAPFGAARKLLQLSPSFKDTPRSGADYVKGGMTLRSSVYRDGVVVGRSICTVLVGGQGGIAFGVYEDVRSKKWYGGRLAANGEPARDGSDASYGSWHRIERAARKAAEKAARLEMRLRGEKGLQ